MVRANSTRVVRPISEIPRIVADTLRNIETLLSRNIKALVKLQMLRMVYGYVLLTSCSHADNDCSLFVVKAAKYYYFLLVPSYPAARLERTASK